MQEFWITAIHSIFGWQRNLNFEANTLGLTALVTYQYIIKQSVLSLNLIILTMQSNTLEVCGQDMNWMKTLVEPYIHTVRHIDLIVKSMCVYMDFCKVFDSVSHDRLLQKLSNVGISGSDSKHTRNNVTRVC